MTGGLAESLVGGEEGGSNMKFMSVLTDPLVKSIIKVGFISFCKIRTSKLRHLLVGKRTILVYFIISGNTLYEDFHILHFQQGIVSSESIHGNTIS